MCGIAGFNWKEEALSRKMAESLAFRGPDAEGFYTDDCVTLIHRRLAVLDLTPAARQPMTNEDESLWLTYNGEIYNFVELASELKAMGYHFRSRSDSEILIHGYHAWGRALLRRLNGMFAFALYDKINAKLFLARDRFGVKPLHFWHRGNDFIFASEIKTILCCPKVSRRANASNIYDYLAFNFYNHTPETFFEGIKALPPGHYLIYDLVKRSYELVRWYQIPREDSSRMTESQMTERFRGLFLDAIRIRLRTDVEIGSCLSGGLDSSSIVCFLASLLDKGRSDFKVFSAIVKNPEISELPYVEAVISKTGVHSYRTCPTDETLNEDLERLVYFQEEPFAGTSIFAQWEVMKLAKKHSMKVLLDGQGGDELMAGYPFFAGYYFLELIRRGKWGSLVKEVQAYRSKQTFAPWEGLLTPFFLLCPKRWKPLLWDYHYGDVLLKSFQKRYSAASHAPFEMYQPLDLNDALRYRFQLSLPQLLREEDRNSMAFSVETRLPFLDYRLVEFVLGLPAKMKIRNGLTKHVLREAMANELPEIVKKRTQKLGFSTPMHDWLKAGPVSDRLARILGSDQSQIWEYVDRKKARLLYEEFQSGKRPRLGQVFWKMLNLEIWFQMFIEGRMPQQFPGPPTVVLQTAPC